MSLENSSIKGRLVLASSSPSLVLEPNSKITIQLLDITSPTTLPDIIGQQSMLVRPPGPPGATTHHRQYKRLHRQTQAESPTSSPSKALTLFPMYFQVEFDPTRIQQDRAYALSANAVSSKGRLESIATQRVLVLTKGAPSNNVVVTIRTV